MSHHVTTAAHPTGPGPFVPDDNPQAEVIAEIRVHGNAYLRDDEVLKLAGIAVGQPLPADGERIIEQRLKASGHFDTLKYASATGRSTARPTWR